MRAGLYPKLAWDRIRKNKRFYLPYILTCIGMVMMFYIIHYLAAMPTIKDMPGGDTMEMVLGLGTWVVALFAVIFLFYTNSFLMRRRQKEFGLYNMLGMGKNHLSLLLLWENGILFVISMVGGLLGGILLSKMAELFMLMLLGGEVTYTLRIDPDAFGDTWVIFIPVFALIFLKGLIQIRRSSAIALIKSETVGEKPPKANYLFGIAGILILAGAYYIALSIKSPLIAMAWFFLAVCMVIVATYLLFISGSVMLCRLLQKNKHYYYKPNHFVSVSSMVYRMKRNGAGLASICVLSTMVLVIMMGAGSLYAGKEDSLNIHSIGTDGEFLLTILASFAQEESLSASENQKWRIRKKFEEGIPTGTIMMGYQTIDGEFVIIPEEAEVVRMIFSDYLSGMGLNAIVRKLRDMGIPTKHERTWKESVVRKMLTNEKYKGDMRLQKCFRLDHISKKTVKNEGQLPQYYVEEAHEAIIDKDTFDAVQEELKRRSVPAPKAPPTIYPFTRKIVCEKCGKNYRRKTTASGIRWICTTFNTYGKAYCDSQQIPESTLEMIVGDRAFTQIRIPGPGVIKVQWEDGSETVHKWSNPSRSESWTPEMRMAVGAKTRARKQTKKEDKHGTT